LRIIQHLGLAEALAKLPWSFKELNPQKHEIIISSDLTCITDQFWAVVSVLWEQYRRKEGEREEKKKKPQAFFLK